MLFSFVLISNFIWNKENKEMRIAQCTILLLCLALFLTVTSTRNPSVLAESLQKESKSFHQLHPAFADPGWSVKSLGCCPNAPGPSRLLSKPDDCRGWRIARRGLCRLTSWGLQLKLVNRDNPRSPIRWLINQPPNLAEMPQLRWSFPTLPIRVKSIGRKSAQNPLLLSKDTLNWMVEHYPFHGPFIFEIY